MNHRKRGYNRDEFDRHRDYKLFAIACEGGEREPEYFKLFEFMSRRIKVDIIEEIITDEEFEIIKMNKSAPQWVLTRAIEYIEKQGLSDEDDLWFVMDTDLWTDEQIREINNYCNEKPNRNIVISNPCFEVWLIFHKKSDISQSESVSSRDFKQELHSLVDGGYNRLSFIPDIFSAIENAKRSDINTEYFKPEPKTTRVYQLAEALLAKIGIRNFQDFLDNRLPEMKKNGIPEIQKKDARTS